jgi:hypothetical protein
MIGTNHPVMRRYSGPLPVAPARNSRACLIAVTKVGGTRQQAIGLAHRMCRSPIAADITRFGMPAQQRAFAEQPPFVITPRA